MLYEGKIWVGTGDKPVCLLPEMSDRHGLIVGAPGTGKTVTARVLAEGFSSMGVPVVISDIKGSLSGLVLPGEHHQRNAERLAECGVPTFCYRSFPTVFWDVYGISGHPIRTIPQDIDPPVLGRMLGLNDTQTDVLDICFRVAKDEGMLILDLRDLQAMLAYIGENAKTYALHYGYYSTASIGVILRAIAVFEEQRGSGFFGEPALNVCDLLMKDEDGYGVINLLACDKLIRNPEFCSGFLMWLLSELYEKLPDVGTGSLDKPRLVLFLDDAHVLFRNCSHKTLNLIERIIRMIRTKGIAVYFITGEPADIPVGILGLLGNKIVHALRTYTPPQQHALYTLAQTFRPNPSFDSKQAITTLRDGQALVSFLDRRGVPTVVERATILLPQSYMWPISGELRREMIRTSPIYGLYETPIDRETAYRTLTKEGPP